MVQMNVSMGTGFGSPLALGICPGVFGYGVLGEEQFSCCVPHRCTNTAVQDKHSCTAAEGGNGTC